MTQVWNKLEKALAKGEMVILCNTMSYKQQEKEEILKNYCYALIEISEHKGARILHIRDPLDTRIYKKNWMQTTTMFSEDSTYVNSKVQNEEENDTLYIPYMESIRIFDTALITKFGNWEEVRLLGHFTLLKDYEDPKFNLTISKWYYIVKILIFFQNIFQLFFKNFVLNLFRSK